MSTAPDGVEAAPDLRRAAARWALAALFVGVGVAHLVDPAPFLRIMPPFVPAHGAAVAVSGVAEIAGGVGLLVPQTRPIARWALLALLVAVFPANLYMAVAGVQPVDGAPVPAWAAWARLPLQPVLMALVAWSSPRATAAPTP